MRRDLALNLLAECRGDEIWSPEYCGQRGVPDSWLARWRDAFESGFETDRQSIYVAGRLVNQFDGIRDYDLAIELGRVLGVNVDRIVSGQLGPLATVRAIKEAVQEG